METQSAAVRELEARVTALENALSVVQKKLVYVSGSPIITAHYGARFDLNDDINVMEINRLLALRN